MLKFLFKNNMRAARLFDPYYISDEDDGELSAVYSPVTQSNDISHNAPESVVSYSALLPIKKKTPSLSIFGGGISAADDNGKNVDDDAEEGKLPVRKQFVRNPSSHVASDAVLNFVASTADDNK